MATQDTQPGAHEDPDDAPIRPGTDRFPHRDEVYARLHRTLGRRVPDPEAFDDALAAFDAADAGTLNRMRQAPVRRMLQDTSESVRNLLAASFLRLGGSQRRIETDAEVRQFCTDGGEIFAMYWSTVIDASRVQRPLLELVLRALADSSPEYRHRIGELAAAHGWTDDRALRYAARVTARTVEPILRGDEGTVPMAFVTESCYQCLCMLLRHGNRAYDYIHDGVARAARAEERSPMARHDLEVPDQSHEDQNEVERVAAVGELELSVRLLRNVRSNTDRIRTELIPRLVRERVPLREAYWRIHEAHFSADPLLSHMHSDTLREVGAYAASHGGRAFYDASVGRTRQLPVASGPNDHVAPQYLPVLEERFFAELERALEGVRGPDDFARVLATADMANIALHLPFDGAGRTTEDFMAFLGARAGYPLTLSSTGYRHVVGGGADARTDLGDAYKREFDTACLANLGINADPSIPNSGWATHVRWQLAGRFEEDGPDLFRSEQALETQRIIAAIGAPAGERTAVDRYATVPERRALWLSAIGRPYAVAGSPAIAEECDRVVAAANLHFDQEARIAIYELRWRHPEDPLVARIFDEYLRPTHTRGLWRLAQALYAEGQHDAAIPLLRRLLEILPDNVVVLQNLGAALADAGDAEEAAAAFRRAAELSPGSSGAQLRLAVALIRGGNTPGAHAALQAYVDHGGDTRDSAFRSAARQAGFGSAPGSAVEPGH